MEFMISILMVIMFSLKVFFDYDNPEDFDSLAKTGLFFFSLGFVVNLN